MPNPPLFKSARFLGAPVIAMAVLCASLPAAAQAQEAGNATATEVKNGYFDIKVFVSAMQAEQIPADAKDVLAGCLYQNSFKTVSSGVTKVVGENSGKLKRDDADDVLRIMLGICGYEPTAAGGKAPAANADAPVGR